MFGFNKERCFSVDTRFNGLEGVIDKVGRSYKDLRVHVQGSYWPAMANRAYNFAPGDPIRVLDRRNIKLIIEPV